MTEARPAVVTLFRTAAVLLAVTVLMGSMVAATESGAACPTWPGCYPGQFGPRFHLNPLVEFTHRVIAGIALLTCLAAGTVGLRDPAVDRWIKPLPFVAAAGGAASAVFGALTVLVGIGKAAGVVDLTAALVAMAAAIVAAVRVASPGAPWRWSRVTVGAGSVFALAVVMHGLGIVVAAPNSFTRVISWPVWAIVPGDLSPVLQGVRIALAAVVLLVAGSTVAFAWARRRVAALLLAVALAAELVTGLVVRAVGLSPALSALYAGFAVTVLATAALLAALASVGDRPEPHPKGGVDAAAGVPAADPRRSATSV